MIIARGVFRCVPDLQRKLMRHIARVRAAWHVGRQREWRRNLSAAGLDLGAGFAGEDTAAPLAHIRAQDVSHQVRAGDGGTWNSGSISTGSSAGAGCRRHGAYDSTTSPHPMPAATHDLHSAGHQASGAASLRACDSRDFRNSTVTCIKIPPTTAVLRFAATILQYKYLKSELGATKKYGSK